MPLAALVVDALVVDGAQVLDALVVDGAQVVDAAAALGIFRGLEVTNFDVFLCLRLIHISFTTLVWLLMFVLVVRHRTTIDARRERSCLE